MFDKKLGISVYIGNKSIQEDLDYITLAHSYGYSRIFSCFLMLKEDTKEQFLNDFKIFMQHAKSLNFEVYIDVNPFLMKLLGASYENLHIFEELGVTGIRLDESYSGAEEAMITCSGGLKVEINASNGTKLLDNIISFQACKSNLIACHNFYPKKYTGLSKQYFMQCSKDIKDKGIRLAAFVNSNAENTFSSQVIKHGLVTMEHHRGWNIVTQAKEMFYCGLIDDVIIGNAYASKEELQQLAHLDKNVITLDVILEKDSSALAKDMLQSNLHMNRGDVSEYLIRSTMLRIKYSQENVDEFNNKQPITKGCITIDNNLSGKYKGELNIARQDIPNDGNANIVAKVAPYDMFLLEYIKAWSKFKLNIINK